MCRTDRPSLEARGHLPSFDEGEDAVFLNQTGAQYDVEMDVNIGEGDIPKPAFFKVSNANVTGSLLVLYCAFLLRGIASGVERLPRIGVLYGTAGAW